MRGSLTGKRDVLKVHPAPAVAHLQAVRLRQLRDECLLEQFLFSASFRNVQSASTPANWTNSGISSKR